jgi:hypothetical protein
MLWKFVNVQVLCILYVLTFVTITSTKFLLDCIVYFWGSSQQGFCPADSCKNISLVTCICHSLVHSYSSGVSTQFWKLLPPVVITDKKAVVVINIFKIILLKEIKFTDIILMGWTCNCYIFKQWQDPQPPDSLCKQQYRHLNKTQNFKVCCLEYYVSFNREACVRPNRIQTFTRFVVMRLYQIRTTIKW